MVDDFEMTDYGGAPVDNPPSVSTTTPANNATGVAVGADITVNFSESVDVAAGAFTLACPTGTAKTFTTTPALPATGTTSVVLNPDSDLPQSTVCTVTVAKTTVTDKDGTADEMAADHTFSFTTASADPCADPFTPIYQIQGSGASSPIVNTAVDVEGIVVGDFQGAAGHYGFYIQDPTGDSNAATSDGIFVYVPDANAFSGIDVQVGDALHLRGTVKEYNTITEIDTLTALNKCGTGSVAATIVDLPEAVNGDLEKYEGMLITFPETLTVSQNYFQGRYGQVTLSPDGRMYNPTNGNGLGDTVELNARRILVLDDGYSGQNPSPIPYIGLDNTLRAGDTVAGLTGTLDYGPINATSPYIYDYRLQPTQAVSFTRVNARTAAPASVGGSIKVASFNVLNYFTTWGCGDACRGANNATEFNRQRTKIIAALQAINADVVGLMEIENNDATAVGDLVTGLNSAMGPGTYAYVSEPAPGTDDIKVAMIYKPGMVAPDGAAQNYQTSTAAYNPLFDRPPLAQTFTVVSTGEKFTVIVNHFKSKGSCPSSGVDVDTGQGCWNVKRTAQAAGLLDFVTALKTSAQDEDVLVIGDLNAYGAEDPIQTLIAGGLVNEVAKIPPAQRYSYIFDGQSGYLDQGLATASLDAQISGQTIWHINADEPLVIDYNTEFKPQDLYTPTPYRSSDHDPVIIGLDLTITNDLGNLPAPYDPAWHGGNGAVRLGSAWVAGAGTTTNDGVVRTAGVNWQAGAAGGSIDVTVTGAAGYFSAWIDWNGNNSFADAGEFVINNRELVVGTHTLTFDIPAGVTFSKAFNARFRLYATSQKTLLAAGFGPDAAPSPSGGASGGEVEDYTWDFGPNAVGLRSLTAAPLAPAAWPAAIGLAGLLGLAALRRRR